MFLKLKHKHFKKEKWFKHTVRLTGSFAKQYALLIEQCNALHHAASSLSSSSLNQHLGMHSAASLAFQEGTDVLAHLQCTYAAYLDCEKTLNEFDAASHVAAMQVLLNDFQEVCFNLAKAVDAAKALAAATASSVALHDLQGLNASPPSCLKSQEALRVVESSARLCIKALKELE